MKRYVISQYNRHEDEVSHRITRAKDETSALRAHFRELRPYHTNPEDEDKFSDDDIDDMPFCVIESELSDLGLMVGVLDITEGF